MANIDKALLVRLIQQGHAMAVQLQNQGYYGEGSCKEPCVFNATTKKDKHDRNLRLADEWEALSELIASTLND